MAFWSDLNVEPKRSFRWYFTIGKSDENALQTYAIKTVKKPSFTISEVPHQFVAHTFYFPGRITWNTVDVTFIDPVIPDQASAITNMVVAAGYNVPRDESAALKSFSKAKFANAGTQASITQIDAEGDPIEIWTLNNSFFTNVDYGQLDYGSEEMVINSVTIRYDYATLEVMSGNPISKLTP